MKISNLVEGLSSKLYHATYVGNAVNILHDNHFTLSSSIGVNLEFQLSKEYPYYLSTTRTKFGDFHSNAIRTNTCFVMFNLNGDYYKNRYKGVSVDYFNGKYGKYNTPRNNEAEDRILSKKPIIPIDGIEEIHIYYNTFIDQSYDNAKNVRTLMLLSKTKNIPVFLYNDKKNWLSQNKIKNIPINEIPKKNPTTNHNIIINNTTTKNINIKLWLELIHKKSLYDLSKPAMSLLFTEIFSEFELDDSKLSQEFIQNRRPVDKNRKQVVNIISYMNDNKLKTPMDLLNNLQNKWKDIYKKEKDLPLSKNKKSTMSENNYQNHSNALKNTGFWGKQGAGCIFLSTKTGRICIAHRSSMVQEPNTWGTWGGAIDANEKPKNAIKREIEEETGYTGNFKLYPLYIFESKSFKYHNYLALVKDEFKPILDWENQGFIWCEIDDLPQPLHFGLIDLLKHSGDIINNIITIIKKKNNNEDN